MKISIWKYFSQILLRNVHQFQGFRQAYKRPGPLRAIPSICNQRSFSRVPNKWTGCLLENEKQSHLYTLVRDYTLINFQQKVPPIYLFPPILLFSIVLSHGPPKLLFFCSCSHLPTCTNWQAFIHQKSDFLSCRQDWFL